MKLEKNKTYTLTVQTTTPPDKYKMEVVDIVHGFFSFDFGDFTTEGFYTQKMVNDMVDNGIWSIEPIIKPVVLSDELFRIE